MSDRAREAAAALTILLGGVLVFSAVIALFMILAHKAKAEDYRCSYVQRSYPAYDHWTGQTVTRWRYVRQCVRNHTYYLPEREPTMVYGYARRDSGDERELCRSQSVDVLSTEHQSEESAREAARKLWMAKVQWEVGGAHMNLEEAAGVRWRCGPSNAHDTMSGRLAEAAGTLTGKGGQNMRCALSARPCKGARENDRGRR
jgi:hypothetical protein